MLTGAGLAAGITCRIRDPLHPFSWLYGGSAGTLPDHVKDPAADTGGNIPAAGIKHNVKSFLFIPCDKTGDLFLCFERVNVGHATMRQEREQEIQRMVHAVGCGNNDPVECSVREPCGIECIALQNMTVISCMVQ